MKKKLLAIILTASMSLVPSSVFAELSSPIEMQVSEIDPTHNHGTFPKSPMMIPSISLYNHTLYFDTPCDGCTLNIVDENNVVVYTMVIPSGTASLVLPSTLSGEYELQIICGNYLFYGKIDLP